jgi:hypothetical protein
MLSRRGNRTIRSLDLFRQEMPDRIALSYFSPDFGSKRLNEA